jgi:DNA-binding MarR family transcriptional regulator
MGLVERNFIVSQLSPPLDNLLANQLLDEFVSMERRFIQRDWGPTELDGGRFCEALARILYHIDSGTLDRARYFDDCLKYVENNNLAHNIAPRHNALHLGRVLRTVYKFRNQRGVAHISPHYTPNQMDSKFVIESVRWCMNETIRIFWNGNRDMAAKAIRELLQFDVPAIGSYEDIILVQRSDLTCEEEVIVLLHYAGEAGFSRNEIGRHCMYAPSSITTVLKKLVSPQYRQAVQLPNGRYRLTDLGSKRVREHLADKLLLQ